MPHVQSERLMERRQDGLEERLDSGLSHIIDMYEHMMRSYDKSQPMTTDQKKELKEQVLGAMRASA